MAGRYSRFIPLISVIGDFVILNTLFVAAYVILLKNPLWLTPHYLAFYLYLNVTWLILVFVFGTNKIDRNTEKKTILYANVKIIVFFYLLFYLFFQVSPMSYYLRENIKYLFLIFFSLLIFWKYLLYFAFYFYRKQGFSFSNVVILGYSPRTYDLANYLVNNKWHGYRFLGFFDESRSHKGMAFMPWAELRPFIESHEVHEVYISWTRVPREVVPVVTDLISEYPLKVRIIPDLGNFSFKSAEVINYGMIPVVQIHPGPLSYWYNRWIKRLFDIILSLLVILGILSWMSFLFFLIDLFTGREGVFFRQKRTAIDGKAFYCYKFRSMRKNREADQVQATRDDARITPLGRFLRKTSIDELPQFFNVLTGQMSAVGPRPHMLKHTDLYRKIVKRFMLRHTIKPGITGLAQVNGCRGEIRNRSDIRKRVEFDMNYIENWSFKLDLKIIVLTIWLMIRGQDKAF